jgi:hypothetical protein
MLLGQKSEVETKGDLKGQRQYERSAPAEASFNTGHEACQKYAYGVKPAAIMFRSPYHLSNHETLHCLDDSSVRTICSCCSAIKMQTLRSQSPLRMLSFTQARICKLSHAFKRIAMPQSQSRLEAE